MDRFSPLDESLTVAEPWVTGVPDRVPEKVERQHHNGAGETREDHQWPVGNEDIGDAPPIILPQVGVGGGIPTREAAKFS
jgi:hypothetical protein